VLSGVSCGWPSPAEEYYDRPVDLTRHLVSNPPATFLVRAAGDSMRDAGIGDGDELVVDRSVPAADGRIVVAIVDAEMTLKRLARVDGGWVLRAANPDYPDIPVRGSDARVWGVVTAVIHRV
jgi:DNA polymerase V